MEKYLYFRKDSTVTNDDDPGNGSNIYPISSFQGMCVGDSTTAGVVTGAGGKVSLFFKPQRKNHVAAEGDAGDDHLDVVVLDITDHKAKDVMSSLVDKINEPVAKDNGLVVVFDAVTSDKVSDSITGIHVVDQVVPAD
tara:strand:+ start:62 stop:475 length:414 start_codon:yes stop_codon:yes gene_type:complete